MKKELPDANFVISSITETGHAEAKRSLPEAEGYFFLPLDFSCLMKKTVKVVNPDLLILVEGEFWFQLLKETNRAGAKTVLVNGKLSERSFKRFSLLSFFSRKLFSYIDEFSLQSERYEKPFLQLGVPKEKIAVTGNLKLDVAFAPSSESEKEAWKKELGITDQDCVVVIGSTHEPEEKMLLSELAQVWAKIPHLKVIIVPRHPERFAQVAAMLKENRYPTLVYSQRAQKRGDEKVVLIDAMGLLLRSYQIAEVAIVAGSYVSHVGGHNIFEPVQVGVPVLFGPYMRAQLDLVDLVVKSGAGKQVEISQLSEELLSLLTNRASWEAMHERCKVVTAQSQGSTERAWDRIKPLTIKALDKDKTNL
jgi:3-deoxy-D-manno-octulosonic-acid transferase